MSQPTSPEAVVIRCKHCHAVIATRTTTAILVGVLEFTHPIKPRCGKCGRRNRLDPTTSLALPPT